MVNTIYIYIYWKPAKLFNHSVAGFLEWLVNITLNLGGTINWNLQLNMVEQLNIVHYREPPNMLGEYYYKSGWFIAINGWFITIIEPPNMVGLLLYMVNHGWFSGSYFEKQPVGMRHIRGPCPCGLWGVTNGHQHQNFSHGYTTVCAIGQSSSLVWVKIYQNLTSKLAMRSSSHSSSQTSLVICGMWTAKGAGHWRTAIHLWYLARSPARSAVVEVFRIVGL